MLYRRILDALTTTLTMMVSSPYGGTALLLAVVLTLLVPTTYVLVDHPTLRPLLPNVLAIAIGATIGWLWGGVKHWRTRQDSPYGEYGCSADRRCAWQFPGGQEGARRLEATRSGLDDTVRVIRKTILKRLVSQRIAVRRSWIRHILFCVPCLR